MWVSMFNQFPALVIVWKHVKNAPDYHVVARLVVCRMHQQGPACGIFGKKIDVHVQPDRIIDKSEKHFMLFVR